MAGQRSLHQAILDSTDPMTVFNRIVRQCLVLIPHADGASLEVRRDAGHLEYVCAAGTLEPFLGLRLPVHSSLSGTAALTGEAQWCEDTLTDERVNPEAVKATGIRSMLCVPLAGDEREVAVIKVSSQSPEAFDDQDLAQLRRHAEFLSASAHAASLLADVTASLLDELAVLSPGEQGDTVSAARFVANVLTPGLVEQLDARGSIEDAIAHERLDVLFMPIVDLETGAVPSCEALSRFADSEGRGPEWWFAAAAAANLGPELEMVAIRKALALLDALPQDIHVALNASYDTVLHPGFLPMMEGAPLARITIEITEHQEVTEYQELLARLEPLRNAGARLSLDDTGSGYSGLRHILRLRPDVIKLDRELVTGIDQDPAKTALAGALVTFAHSIDAVVIAEGIETESEAAVLRDLGADYGQGFLFGRATHAAQL